MSSFTRSSSVICKEVFDDGYEPSVDEINEYATHIGINPKTEPHLLHIAKEGLLQAIPSEWQICYNDDCDGYYYYNTRTKVCQWQHPLDGEYKNLVDKARKSSGHSTNDLSEDASQIDSGIKSLQGDDSDVVSPVDTVSSSTGAIRKMDTSLQHTGRFLAPLEKRSSSHGLLAPLAPIDSARNKRFEITGFPTNSPLPTPQIGLLMKNVDPLHVEPLPKSTIDNAAAPHSIKGFTLSGKGSMFLKSNTSAKRADAEADGRSFANSVKSILRDTSLTDVRSRLDAKIPDDTAEDRKIVRFNLNDAAAGASNDLVMTDASSNEEEENDDWDLEGEDDDDEGAETHVKEVTMTLARNGQRGQANENNEKDAKDSSNLAAMFERNLDAGRIRPLYEDTDSTDSVASIKSAANLRQITVKSQQQQQLKPLENKVTGQLSASPAKSEQQQSELEKFQQKLDIDLAEEKRNLFESYEKKRVALENEHKSKLQQMEMEYQEKTNDKKIELESQHNVDVENFKLQLMKEFDEKRKTLAQEYRVSEAKLQESHKVLLHELDRDLKSEGELIRKEHASNLTHTKDKLAHDLDVEKQRMRETGESHLYEKMRCEKRLLEDKYRCLKDKYSRLKSDVKISLERRHQRRTEQQSITTGSETERTQSNQPANHDIRSSSVSSKENDIGKPPPPVQAQRKSRRDKSVERDRSAHGHDKSSKKFGVAAKYLSHIQSQHYPDDTSISQSDTTISNTFHHTSRRTKHGQSLADNGNSDSEAIQPEDNNNVRDGHGRSRKKSFTRTKSASTSRLHSSNQRSNGTDPHARPCTPVENLRRQLQQLEDLEDQFPDNSLDTTYHLRYPFSVDGGKEHGASSSELEFFKHRIHMERDSVRRAKESLSTQRGNFRLRQREIKHRHKSANRHTVDQMIQEEKELTEMEVNLHRTRALLGEKVIRLRHLEQSLQRLYDTEKPHLAQAYANSDNNKDEATLSDLSSHSSSGFSSTDFASETNQAGGQRREMYQESTEIIQSLENLNAEIREIWDILSKQHSQGLTPPPSILYKDLNWPMNHSAYYHLPDGTNQPANAMNLNFAPMPTLADRLETYRQLATGRNSLPTSNALPNPSNIQLVGAANVNANANASAMVSDTFATNYNLIERTQDLRNWLKHAKTEHELLNGSKQTDI